MNYYKQGDAAKADKIKAAFEKLGINVLDFGFADKTLVYCSIGGCVQSLPYSINLMHILYSHPDYKELELPVEPKFKVGDWIVSPNGSQYLIAYIDKEDNRYLFEINEYTGEPMHYEDVQVVDGQYHLWTIADAKDGDVLATDNGWTCIFKAFDGCGFSSYCFMDSQRWFCKVGAEGHTLDSRINGNIHPATKEQRDIFFHKMKEAGYQWDSDNKELHKIQPHYDIKNFKPFDKVLVRCADDEEWAIEMFSKYYDSEPTIHGRTYRFMCIADSYTQCIPFEGNEHLLGTTDMCDEMYINW